jgi:chemotaxis protein MotB
MTRLAFAVFAMAVLAAGCAERTPLIDPVMADENVRLKQQVSDLEGRKTGLEKALIDQESAISAKGSEAEEWRRKYQAAKDAVPPGGELVPPEIMKAFIDIARAGGPWEVGEGGSLKTSSDVFFDSGKTDLKPAGQQALKDIAGTLKEILADKRVLLRVDGHTDNEKITHSPFKDNTHLSLMRAHAVVTFLSQQGVPAPAMYPAGFGEFRPVASNADASGRARNRRVELTLINASSPGAGTPPAVEPAPPPK